MVRSGNLPVTLTGRQEPGADLPLDAQVGQEPQLLRRLSCQALGDPDGLERPFTAFGGMHLGDTILGRLVACIPFCSAEISPRRGWHNGSEIPFDALSEDVRLDRGLGDTSSIRWGHWAPLLGHRRQVSGIYFMNGTIRMSEHGGAIIRPLAVAFMPAVSPHGDNLVSGYEFEYPGSVREAGLRICHEHRFSMPRRLRSGKFSHRGLGRVMARHAVVIRRAAIDSPRYGGSVRINDRLVPADRLGIPRYLRHTVDA